MIGKGANSVLSWCTSNKERRPAPSGTNASPGVEKNPAQKNQASVAGSGASSSDALDRGLGRGDDSVHQRLTSIHQRLDRPQGFRSPDRPPRPPWVRAPRVRQVAFRCPRWTLERPRPPWMPKPARAPGIDVGSLDRFRRRPGPRWTTTAGAAEEAAELLQGLAELARSPPGPQPIRLGRQAEELGQRRQHASFRVSRAGPFHPFHSIPFHSIQSIPCSSIPSRPFHSSPNHNSIHSSLFRSICPIHSFPSFLPSIPLFPFQIDPVPPPGRSFLVSRTLHFDPIPKSSGVQDFSDRPCMSMLTNTS